MSEQSCLIIAGEKSGEEHALSFFNELKTVCPTTRFYGVGGDELKNNGLELLFHLNDFSSWGYSEVFAKIPFYINSMNSILNEVEKRKTKTAILIDFQSFNLKLAGKLKERGVEVLYYVAPQAWAWKEYRVKKLAKSVHTLFTIIPFEKKWFRDRGVKNVISIDHPLWTTYQNDLEAFSKPENLNKPFHLLLLPGSRKFEVETLLPLFVEALSKLKKEMNLKVSVVKSSSVPNAIYDSYKAYFDEEYTNEDLVVALKKADFSFAASGTVTLTCALYEVPTIVCYKTSLLNQFIYETVVNYRGFISLANIIQNRLVFPEFLQDHVSSYNIVSYFQNWYYNSQKRLNLKKELQLTRELVRGEKLNIPVYMAEVINKSYGQKVDSNI
jgi:lipid-A-disaccharide synthase